MDKLSGPMASQSSRFSMYAAVSKDALYGALSWILAEAFQPLPCRKEKRWEILMS